MERSNIISFLIGRFRGKYPNDPDPRNVRIYVDQMMIMFNLPPLTNDDNELLKQLVDEVSISMLSAGANRQERRRLKNDN
jgi:hypothetical protein